MKTHRFSRQSSSSILAFSCAVTAFGLGGIMFAHGKDGDTLAAAGAAPPAAGGGAPTLTPVQEYRAVLDKAKAENRSLNSDEAQRLDILKAEIDKDVNARAAAAELERRETEYRSIAAAQGAIDKTAPAAADPRPGANAYLRSIAKGNADVGNKEVIADVVRQFESQSPIFAAHANVQQRSTGNAFQFTKVTKGSTDGYAKTEGNTGRTDGTGTGATASSVGVATIAFTTYSGELMTVTQEMLDDAAADVAAEVIGLGSGKATMAFDADAITELESAFLSYTDTAATTWAVADLIDIFLAIPNRNRYGVKYVTSAATAAKLLALMTTDNAPALAAIGFSKDSLVIDDNVTTDVVLGGNITLALAIGMRVPVRVFTQEVSAGRNFEVQPRLAVALRDATALAARKRKAA